MTKYSKRKDKENIPANNRIDYFFGFAHCRLDLAFPVGMLTRVMHAPSEHHLKQLMDLLKYINATIDWKLNFVRDLTLSSLDIVTLSSLDIVTHPMLMTNQQAEALEDIFSS